MLHQAVSGSSSELVDVIVVLVCVCCCFFLLLLAVVVDFCTFYRCSLSFFHLINFTCEHCVMNLPVSEFMFWYPISHGSVCICAETEKNNDFTLDVCKHSVLVWMFVCMHWKCPVSSVYDCIWMRETRTTGICWKIRHKSLEMKNFKCVWCNQMYANFQTFGKMMRSNG